MAKINTHILDYIKKHNLISPGSSIVLGLSGGPDSVFLFHILVELRNQGIIKQLIAAHLDHQWRSNSSDDVVFCKELAQHHNVTCISAALSEFAPKIVNGSKEEIGRKARRAFLETVAKNHQANTIALAHHKDDQQETFFLRLIRGASLAGLTGMKPKYGMYIRPLLETRKAEILQYLNTNNIAYLTDPSNTSHDFLRNRIRLMVIPALKACDDRFDASFMRTVGSLQETEVFLQDLTTKIFKEISTHHDETYYLDLQQLLAQHSTMLQRLLVHWFCTENVQFPVSQGFFNEVIKFLSQPTGGEHHVSERWSLMKKQKTVSIRKII